MIEAADHHRSGHPGGFAFPPERDRGGVDVVNG
jgi:hypothetical protein